MTNFPIAASASAPTASRRAQANALQQNAGLPGAVQADKSSFRDALVQMLGKGVANAFSAAGDPAVVSSKADSGRKTDAQTDPALDSSVLPNGLALPLPPVLTSALAPAAPVAGAALDASALPNGLALPLSPVLTSALAPAAAATAAAPALDASALPLRRGLTSALAPEATAVPALDASALPLRRGLTSALAPAAATATATATEAPALDASALPLRRGWTSALAPEATAAPALDASALPLRRGWTSALAPAATATATATAATATDAPALDASALPLPQALASALIPAAATAGPALDASALPVPQVLVSALIPAATGQASLRTVLASSKAALDPQTGADTADVLDASALPAGLAPAHLVAKTAPANALLAVAPEPLKDALAAPVFETASSRTEPPVAFSIAAQAAEMGGSTPTRGVPEPSASVQTRVGERAWDQAVGEKLVWMVNQKHQVAQLHLNPPELGPLKISISLDQNQASAQFFSAHASVREALETAMPRLREMLADSGITLGNASVGTEAFREPTQQQPRAHVTQSDAFAADSGTVSSAERLLRPMLGLVDTFA